jgi:hypothetical protein
VDRKNSTDEGEKCYRNCAKTFWQAKKGWEGNVMVDLTGVAHEDRRQLELAEVVSGGGLR